MSTAVTTYLKIEDHFIPVKEFTGPLPDEFYIEGLSTPESRSTHFLD